MISLINPSIGLGLILPILNKKLNKKLTAYKLVYDETRDDNKLYFLIEENGDTKTYPYNSDKLEFLIRSTINNKIKKGCTLDVVIIDYSTERETICKYAYTDDKGYKEKDTFNL